MAQNLAESAGGQSGGSFPPFEPTFFVSQLFWLAVTFALFYWAMSRLILPRIAGILEDRRDRIAGDRDAAERLVKESEASREVYDTTLSEARSRAGALIAERRALALSKADQKRRQAEEIGNQRIEEAERAILKAQQAALAEMEEVAVEAAGNIVKSVLGKRPAIGKLRSAVSQAQEVS